MKVTKIESFLIRIEYLATVIRITAQNINTGEQAQFSSFNSLFTSSIQLKHKRTVLRIYLKTVREYFNIK